MTDAIYGPITIDVRARLLLHEKRLVASAENVGVAELKIWEVARSQNNPTGRKFRLFFVVDGNVLFGFDNHKPKGPHLHFGGQETSYAFTTVEQLVEDFWDLVRKAGFVP